MAISVFGHVARSKLQISCRSFPTVRSSRTRRDTALAPGCHQPAEAYGPACAVPDLNGTLLPSLDHRADSNRTPRLPIGRKVRGPPLKRYTLAAGPRRSIRAHRERPPGEGGNPAWLRKPAVRGEVSRQITPHAILNVTAILRDCPLADLYDIYGCYSLFFFFSILATSSSVFSVVRCLSMIRSAASFLTRLPTTHEVMTVFWTVLQGKSCIDCKYYPREDGSPNRHFFGVKL